MQDIVVILLNAAELWALYRLCKSWAANQESLTEDEQDEEFWDRQW